MPTIRVVCFSCGKRLKVPESVAGKRVKCPKCFDKFLECNTDADCGDKGDRFCELYTDSYGSSSRCRFRACSPAGECPHSLAALAASGLERSQPEK